jgi:hypothetical protein
LQQYKNLPGIIMKKILIGIFICALLFTVSVYFFIPENITVASEITTTSSIGSVQRITGSSDYRIKWFPKEGKMVSPTKYVLDGCTYQFGTDNSDNNNIAVQYENINTSSLLTPLTGGNDSLIVNWRLNQQCGYNPFNRISYYFSLRHIKKTNEKILLAMQAFLSNKKNVYGFDVNQEKQTDSTLISIKATVPNHPTVTEIYTNIEKLKQYAVVNNANTTNAPMLNIKNDGTGKWQYMVALPIDKALENKGDIIAKRMFAGGKILITEKITGGPAAINDALQNLEKYKTDYGYMSPAIPFQSLITDRIKETDTSRWKTKLYYPVY